MCGCMGTDKVNMANESHCSGKCVTQLVGAPDSVTLA